MRIEKTRGEWHPTPKVEFYVDFEFCSDLNDDFSKLPEKGGQPLIFMIGCGHVENGEWQFKSLVAENLSAGEEIRIINEWVDHMGSVRDRLDPQKRHAAGFSTGLPLNQPCWTKLTIRQRQGTRSMQIGLNWAGTIS